MVQHNLPGIPALDENSVVTLERGDALLEPSQSRQAVTSRSPSRRGIVSFDISLSPLSRVTTENSEFKSMLERDRIEQAVVMQLLEKSAKRP